MMKQIGLEPQEIAALAEQYEHQSPQAVLSWALERFCSQLAICTSFQADGMALLDMAWRIDPTVRVFTIDTGRLPQETYALLDQVRRETGLSIVTEAMDDEGLESVAEVADIVQIGARNMQNFGLLKRAGRLSKPILLKRGPAASITELLMAAEYVLAGGNPNVILCERGIRGMDATSRNVFDLNAIPAVKQLSHLPILADPSHGTGRRAMVRPMARAAIAAGADGLLVEVHIRPDQALSDGVQSLYPEQFALLMDEVRGIANVIGRRVPAPLR